MAAPGPWLRVDDVELDLRLSGKRAALEWLSQRLAVRIGAAQRAVFGALWEREALGSTALGRGVALPHARLEGLIAPAGAFVRLQQPIAFDAPDEQPVAFVLGLLLPRADPQRQLMLLAGIAGRFSDAGFRDRMAAADDPGTAWSLITGEPAP